MLWPAGVFNSFPTGICNVAPTAEPRMALREQNRDGNFRNPDPPNSRYD
jgi:hypothetical protein